MLACLYDRWMRARACSHHEVPDRPPLRLVPGERVRAGERDDQWPAFVFVSGARGEGWVPARHLSGNGGEVIVLTAYDTTELPVDVGDEVDVLERDDVSGWWWCRNGAGREGWVPVSALERL